jgi:hypothetical protein
LSEAWTALRSVPPVATIAASIVAPLRFTLESGKAIVLRRLLGPGREEQLFQIEIRFRRCAHYICAARTQEEQNPVPGEIAA